MDINLFEDKRHRQSSQGFLNWDAVMNERRYSWWNAVSMMTKPSQFRDLIVVTCPSLNGFTETAKGKKRIWIQIIIHIPYFRLSNINKIIQYDE